MIAATLDEQAPMSAAYLTQQHNSSLMSPDMPASHVLGCRDDHCCCCALDIMCAGLQLAIGSSLAGTFICLLDTA